ncbi:chromosomal replication initiator DnaA [Sulfitobacter sp. M57]|uniref:HdaA/DnaA family protein n=1 Tax=unclassified Sulfitobacter TaxID=196795 RepID=UPI0023E2EE42|nr:MULTISPECIES: chromosomal replication initiator DnaA [unclassified Sulfitobacter]MDF3414289.1 chromosomal replication initiator DnaA [Sulfitobacter sp. KE5]MDF3420429.1 chromosomal replication initiator DnaA [Sulfitobacter sp. KE43]MDF3432835.1 chromosomal replication initiator DnaA [Sulfitobacter sp. KE42]MDF3458475.1 chromosomal replication initiator DnaA [Sulfitobacter sp. S74]MDF3462375.1 chromosomal replication initiator DnaA [Sulfitobacter sp. Ks18]
MAEQLGLNLPSRTALGRDAFFVAPSNALALAMIDTWPAWASGKLVLTGPKGAGKTHLVHVWAAVAEATIIAAHDLEEADIPALAQNHIAVEDVPAIAGNERAETALFHLHNLTLAEGHTLLLTGTPAVAHWGLRLPDLMSRLQGTTAAALEAPDDALLSALLVKLLADRQLTPKPALISYLLGRMDRSFAAAIDLVARLDAASLARKKPITVKLAAAVLDKDTPDA